MKKQEQARFVTFEEDYKIKTKSNTTKVLFKKGQKVAMSVNLADLLKQRNAKMKVEDVDFKKIHDKLKEKKIKFDKEAVQRAYSA